MSIEISFNYNKIKLLGSGNQPSRIPFFARERSCAFKATFFEWIKLTKRPAKLEPTILFNMYADESFEHEGDVFMYNESYNSCWCICTNNKGERKRFPRIMTVNKLIQL